MDYKKILPVVLFSIILSAFVIALTNVNVLSPSSNTNVSDSVLLNATTNATAENATFEWINSTGDIANTTVISGSGTTFDGTFNYAGVLPDGTYNINVTAINSTEDTVKNSTIENVTLDNTAPNVTINDPSEGGNVSGTIKLNATATDVTLSIASVLFRLLNSTDDSVNTTKGVFSNSNIWNSTLNTSSFTDGNYTLQVEANDTELNTNTTQNVSITIDNTNPSISSFSCNDIDEGDDQDCSCSASDSNGTGIKSTSITSADTDSDGEKTVTCTATDYAGNSVTQDTTYDVEGSSSGGGGGSPLGHSYSSTYVYDDKELSEKEPLVRSFGENERTRVKIGGGEHHVAVEEVMSDKVSINVSSKSTKKEVSEGETEYFEVTGDSVYDVAVTVNSISGDEAELTIASSDKEMTEESGGNETVDEETSEEASEEGQQEDTTTTEDGGSSTWIWITLIIIVAGIAGGLFYYFKYKKE